MKNRILSGIVMILIVAGILTAQCYLPIVLVIAAAFLGVGTVIELLHHTGLCKSKPLVALGALPALLVPFVMQGYISLPLTVVYVLYALLVFAALLWKHNQLNISGLLALLVLPILISYAFGSLVSVAQVPKSGMFYLFCVVCWSCMADMGAYFIGVFFGKHKMAKQISPKKSWEGFAGGMVFGTLFAFLLCLLYREALGYPVHLWLTVAISPLFILVGVLGDLTASVIKRKCEIKDFGNLIPGHGGIMDRFDSILMIAPLLWQLLLLIK